MRIPDRITILGKWCLYRLAGQPTNVEFRQLMRFFVSPNYAKRGFKFIKKITEANGDHLEIQFHTLTDPLYWPRQCGLDALSMIVSEQFDPHDWHYYRVPQTEIAPTDTVLDCGASEGLFALIAARICSKVYAVEPLPVFQHAMQLTFKNILNVRLLPCAVGRQPGTVHFSPSGIKSHLTLGRGVEVKMETLDAIFHERGVRIDYLKADLEGAELEMLAGARKLIRAYTPKIAITTYHQPHHAKAIQSFLGTLEPRYRFKVKGLTARGAPVMLHAWVEK
jgi:FkbM family methyltransferase